MKDCLYTLFPGNEKKKKAKEEEEEEEEEEEKKKKKKKLCNLRTQLFWHYSFFSLLLIILQFVFTF